MILVYSTYILLIILFQNNLELHNDICFDVYNIIWRFKLAAEFKMAANSIKSFKC